MERAQGRKAARERAARDAAFSARGQEAAHGFDVETGEVGEARSVAEFAREEARELAEIALVGGDGGSRVVALVRQVIEPRGGRVDEITGERQLSIGVEQVFQWVSVASHCGIIGVAR
jgi:alpha/beta superfamily hydrolase